MIRFHAFGVRFCMPLLTLLTPVLAVCLGANGAFAPLFIALSVHELGHIAAAALMHGPIQEIRLMPFGGSARLANPYLMPGRKLMIVACAGPAANLLLAVCLSALVQWKLLSPWNCITWIHTNLLLFTFNLLPALPLDGGRILYLLLHRFLSEQRALFFCILLSRLLAATLLFVALYGGLVGGIWNLSLVLAAIFIIASEQDERSALHKSHAERLLKLYRDEDGPRPVRIFRMDEETAMLEALKHMHGSERCLFLLTRKSRPRALADDGGLLEFLMHHESVSAPMKALEALYVFEKPSF